MDTFNVVKQFESELCKYTGAKFAVTTNSCTMALLLACAYNKVEEVTIPNKTYISVPQSIIHAGGTPKFEDINWKGLYQLKPYPIWDSARWISTGMYKPGQFVCLSFHWAKTLKLGRGGVILHDSYKADKWLRKARFDGRTAGKAPIDDEIEALGWNCYMSPKEAAEGLTRLSFLPKHNNPLPDDAYADLSKFKIFKKK